jgi:ubiquinone biosynthesis protein
MRILRWPGNLLRGALLLLFLLLVLLLYGIGRIGVAFRRDPEQHRAALARWQGRVLRRSMTIAGATFVKMGQVMSTRPDLFEPEVIAELRKLQDQLPPFAFSRVKRTIEQDLGKPLSQLFAEIDEAPVAAASVAQVHRARLPDGSEVAVKVLRPSIRRQVERDATILLTCARLLHLSPTLRRSDPVGHLRHFVNAIIDQTDLRIERDNYARFHTNFASVQGVRFPRVHEELCSERVLVMEFVRGTKIDALGTGRHPVLAERVRVTMFKMCFEDGFLHADLHPGNMIVREGEELVIFDVGLCKLLAEDVLIQFIDMSKCLSMGTPDDLVGHLRRFHQYLDDVDWDALRVEVDAFAIRFRSQAIGELEYSKLIDGMLAIGRKYHVRPVTDMALVFVALVTAQGIGKQLNPDSNVFSELARFLMPILMKRGESIPKTAEANAAQRPTA